MHYMVAILLMFAPAAGYLIWLQSVYVVPKFKEVAAGAGIRLWPISALVFEHSSWFIGIEMLIFLGLLTLAVVYIGGPAFTRTIQRRFSFPFVDWVAWHISWKRMRLQRTFSAMLAVLLDGGVPEAEAVRLAGECTANEMYRRRVARVLMALQQGTKLDEAVRALDASGEFHWRLSNATHARGGFMNALRGWHESLDAKAFQKQETAAHAITSGIVILNGVVVALFATAFFGVLVAILNGELTL